jgi:hypothetical protein
MHFINIYFPIMHIILIEDLIFNIFNVELRKYIKCIMEVKIKIKFLLEELLFLIH